jgi:anti-anti-sigma factor
MVTPLQISRAEHPDGTVAIALTGEIDLSNVGSLADVLDGIPAAVQVAVDLSNVDYLDSAGLRVLMTHASHVVITANAVLLPAMTISGLAALTTVREVATPD